MIEKPEKTMKVPGYTMSQVTAGFARLARELRDSAESSLKELEARARMNAFVPQGEALGFSRSQVHETVRLVMDNHPEIDVVQAQEMALQLMMSGAIESAKGKDK